MEILDLYDRDRIKTSETFRRGEPVPNDRFHLVIHVCIFNAEGEMLIQKRASDKPTWPGLWDVTVGGAAQHDDSSHQAANRELKEELGIDFDFSQVRPSLTVNFAVGFDDFYLLNTAVKLNDLLLQKDEVSMAVWASEKSILAMIENGQFLPYHPSFISLLFAMRHRMGVLVEL